MITARSLVAPTSNPLLERALADKLQRRSEIGGSLGELEPLAVRLGLMQNTLKPRFRDPQLLVFAADHGLAVDGIVSGAGSIGTFLAAPLPAWASARSIAATMPWPPLSGAVMWKPLLLTP